MEEIIFHDMGWGGMWFGWIFWLAILAIIIWIGVTVTRNLKKSGSTQDPTQTESPLDILKKRYAKGEISREEFEQMKKDIQS
jgi:putative membrane protein